ncbi:molybdate ABC transporter substrate-binding protein [Saccharopolyspora sp. K220]|uniref:molybdate ABC transporter substrate-binding protein n=1 Tax=Saccharopolyspora soli TaxID=2926618 RepID=UPI001F56F210|nr:molybdate ABC transporter substrate-binding protein [Saccharopolyspora soli]MCI2420390.1 molybdate ABC transporter substrate-binding protein [Saccharopolyspora soli]
MSKLRIIVGALLALVLLAGCGQAGAPQQQRTLTVLAAASLTESFEELGARFTADHPDVRVQFDYQGSSTLAEQIRQGRAADVFASADTKNMDKVRDLVGTPEILATNKLTIVVPPGNPAGIASLADLAAPGRTVVVCAPQVPCGSATQEVTRRSGTQLKPVSEEDDVKSVLNKVVAGEADAGLVYVTDARAAGSRVQAVDFPESQQVINTYPIATIAAAPQPQLAAEFMAFARGPVGREILANHGFGAP